MLHSAGTTNFNFQVKAIIVAVNKLYCAFQEIMNEHAKKPMEELPPSLLDEWRNVFATDLQVGTFETWMMFAGELQIYLLFTMNICLLF